MYPALGKREIKNTILSYQVLRLAWGTWDPAKKIRKGNSEEVGRQHWGEREVQAECDKPSGQGLCTDSRVCRSWEEGEWQAGWMDVWVSKEGTRKVVSGEFWNEIKAPDSLKVQWESQKKKMVKDENVWIRRKKRKTKGLILDKEKWEIRKRLTGSQWRWEKCGTPVTLKGSQLLQRQGYVGREERASVFLVDLWRQKLRASVPAA